VHRDVFADHFAASTSVGLGCVRIAWDLLRIVDDLDHSGAQIWSAVRQGLTWPRNFSGGGVPHWERSPSSAGTRFPLFCTFSRSVSAQCS
jgi:hypothetical protein